MSELPDELWTKILELGTSSAAASHLSHRDICSVSITCRRLNRLSSDPSLWSTLLSLHFPSSSSSSSSIPPSKSLYKQRFERDKARRVSAWKMDVLIAESNLMSFKKRMDDLQNLILKETERLKSAARELSNLDRVRRASVALNVWQPAVVRGSQKQIVEQCTVPIESRVSSLHMEVRVCKQQIAIYTKAYNGLQQKLIEGKEELKSLKYHPLKSYEPGFLANDGSLERKKVKKGRECSKKARQSGECSKKARQSGECQ